MVDQMWDVVVELAQRQHGAVARGQLVQGGLSPGVVDGLVRRGRLDRVRRAVYVVAGAPPSWHQEVMTAVLAAGEGAAASHDTAAQLRGLLPRGHTAEVSVAVPHPRQLTLGCVRARSLRDLEGDAVGIVDGIPTVHALRTLVHLGADHPWWTVERALETGLVTRQFSYEAVEWIRHDLSRQGRNGIGVLGAVLEQRALAGHVPESVIEPRMATLCRDHGIAMPEFQVEVRIGGRSYRLDFAYSDLKIAIEVDGFDPHGRRDVWERDRDREQVLLAAGWVVIRVTLRQMVQHPARTAARIKQVLIHRRAT